MKKTSVFFSIILFFWIGISSYWYVCKIKKDCQKSNDSKVKIQKDINLKDKTTLPIKDSISLTEDKNTNLHKFKENFEDELLKGYTIYNFPKNSESNGKIKSDFDEFANLLKKYIETNKDVKVQLTGYTDNSGSKQTNIIFGLKRANFVKKLLVDKQINENVFIVKSKGEEDAIAPNNTKEGRLKNRRVSIKLIKN